MLKTICTYCHTELNILENESPGQELISHGICTDCVHKALAGAGVSFSQFIDDLPGPVAVVDDNGRVIGANSAAQHLLSKTEGQIDNHLLGEVFECAHARLPGGCGETIHCKSCAIRKTVTHTARTGDPSGRVAACMDLCDVTGVRAARFIISTQKVGEVVLLHFEEVPSDK